MPECPVCLLAPDGAVPRDVAAPTTLKLFACVYVVGKVSTARPCVGQQCVRTRKHAARS
jgi:hypothetical protein